MNDPFNAKLHETLLRRGYTYRRCTEYATLMDIYEKEGRVISCDDGDYVVMTEADGRESPLDIFERETENLFAKKPR
jgi:hypothetical protein